MKHVYTIGLLTMVFLIFSCSSDDGGSDEEVPNFVVATTTLNFNSATISWNAISGTGDVFYNIYFNESLEADLISDLSYTFFNLLENTSYSGRVEAVDDTGIIESTNFAFTTPEDTNQGVAPSAFDTSVKHLGHVSTTIQWTSATVPDNSTITYSVFLGSQMIASDLLDLEFYISNLQPNTTYNGVVRAFNGNEFTDSEYSFTTVDSNIFAGRVFLRTQQEVDDFAANHYTEITDWLIIGREDVTSDITDLSGLQTLVTVTGSLFISHNPELESTHGLQNISNDLNAIAIVDNLVMNDLSGFSGINKLLDYINIVDNPQITTLDDFSNMTNGIADVNVELTNNDSLTDIDGLSQLDLFAVYIRENDALENMDLINSSDADSLGLLYIFNNENLNDFSPLSNITLIRGDLTIGYSNVTNLDDLSNLNRTFGDVNIWWNSSLTDLCGLQNIVQGDNIDGVYNVHDNAFNPTFQDILDGNCAQ